MIGPEPGACISVVLVSHNTAALLRECVSSLHTDGDRLVEAIIVVDNASTDGTQRMLRQEFPSVRLIENARNLGFGTACNQGVAAAGGEYVLLLNSDARLQPGALNLLLAALAAPHVGMVGPALVNPDGSAQRSAFRFPKPWVLLLEQSGIADRAAAIAAHHSHRTGARPQSVDWLKGACLLARRELLRQMGPFDGCFFMYAEDTDLCWRLRGAGWGVRLVPQARVTHLGGGSAAAYGDSMLVQFVASTYLFYLKHYDRTALDLAICVVRTTATLKWLRDGVRFVWPSTARVDWQQRRARIQAVTRAWRRVWQVRPEAQLA